MNTPDDLARHSPEASNLSPTQEEATVEKNTSSTEAVEGHTRRFWRPDLSKLAVHLQRISPVMDTPTEPMPVVLAETSSLATDSSPTLPPLFMRLRQRRRATRGDRLEDWQSWSKFRLWRRTRPFWGSLLMIIAGLFILISAFFFLPLAFLTQSLWSALLVGGLLLVMGLLQLFFPTHSMITGAIGIVLSIVSLLVASFGGCGLSMLLGVIGSALSIAWRPVKRSRLLAASTAQPS